MNENLPIGSLVVVMSKEYDIYTAMITEKNGIATYDGVDTEFEYRIVNYPYGFVGVDTLSHVMNSEYIGEVVYNPDLEPDISKEICVSSIIQAREETYLIIGKNVKYLGKEEIPVYACIKYENGNSYEITYIKENEVQEVIRYGYIDNPYRNVDEKRNDKVNNALARYRALLPMGSVVTLEGEKGKVDILIVDRYERANGEHADYLGIFLEAQYKGAVVTFDKQQIIEIKYIGYWDKQEADKNIDILLKKGLITK